MILVYNLYTILHDLVDTIQTQPVATQYHPKWLFLSTDCTGFISIICVDFIYQGFKVWRISIVISIYSVYDICIYIHCIYTCTFLRIHNFHTPIIKNSWNSQTARFFSRGCNDIHWGKPSQWFDLHPPAETSVERNLKPFMLKWQGKASEPKV